MMAIVHHCSSRGPAHIFGLDSGSGFSFSFGLGFGSGFEKRFESNGAMVE